jgi:hypothetical protein
MPSKVVIGASIYMSIREIHIMGEALRVLERDGEHPKKVIVDKLKEKLMNNLFKALEKDLSKKRVTA